MGTASSIALEELEIHTYFAIARANKAKRALRRARLHIKGTFAILGLKYGLRHFLRHVTKKKYERLPEEGIRNLAPDLNKLHTSLISVLRLADERGVTRRATYRRYLEDIRKDTDKLGDVLECYHLSLSPDFRQLVSDTISELGPSQEPLDWKSSLAKMQD